MHYVAGKNYSFKLYINISNFGWLYVVNTYVIFNALNAEINKTSCDIGTYVLNINVNNSKRFSADSTIFKSWQLISLYLFSLSQLAT